MLPEKKKPRVRNKLRENKESNVTAAAADNTEHSPVGFEGGEGRGCEH